MSQSLPPPFPSLPPPLPVLRGGEPPPLPVVDVDRHDRMGLTSSPPPLPAVPRALRRREERTGVSLGEVFRGIGRGVEWFFGLVAFVAGLAVLAALPVLQFLSLGYLLEAGGRVAGTGRFRYGFIGIRTAARVGGIVLGCWLFLLPVRLLAGWA